MAWLVKQHSSYYTQFYDPNRIPSRKRIALKTKFKDLALRKHVELEKAYELGEFDPWSTHQEPENTLSKNSRLGDVLTFYITQKSREDWRDRTAKNTTYVLRAFERVAGAEKPISSLRATDFNDYINREGVAFATRHSDRTKLKPFAKWCAHHKLLRMNLADVKVYNFQQEQKEVVSYLTHSEVATLKQVIHDKVEGDIARRYQSVNRNALWLIDLIDWQRWSGMRISEILSLTPRSFNTETWDITIGSASFTTKSKRKQVLPIGGVKPLRELAERLLNECATIDTPVFGHSDSKRTSRTFKKYVRLALPEREDIHLHSLRHTC
jgi:integrase